jgi:hypothetical protein
MKTTLKRKLAVMATRHPGVEQGVACEGTAIESTTYKTKNKAFLFVGATSIRLKLRTSLPEAKRHAKRTPDVFDVGAVGWVKVNVDESTDAHTLALLERWIEESYRLASRPGRP